MLENSGWALVSFRFSCRIMLWARSTQDAQIYTSDGPSTIGPTSREDLPQKEQVVTRLPRNPGGVPAFPWPGGFGGKLGGPPLPVRLELAIRLPHKLHRSFLDRHITRNNPDFFGPIF